MAQNLARDPYIQLELIYSEWNCSIHTRRYRVDLTGVTIGLPFYRFSPPIKRPRNRVYFAGTISWLVRYLYISISVGRLVSNWFEGHRLGILPSDFRLCLLCQRRFTMVWHDDTETRVFSLLKPLDSINNARSRKRDGFFSTLLVLIVIHFAHESHMLSLLCLPV